jgi:hypothetical protein
MTTRSAHAVTKGVACSAPVLLFLFLAAPAGLRAQTNQDTQELLSRLKTLEERVQSLEAEVETLRAAAQAQPKPAPEEAAPAPAPAVAATPTTGVPSGAAGAGGPSGQLPVYTPTASLTKVFNPDISFIGNFIGSAGRDPMNQFPALELHEGEVGLQAIVDPYARGDIFLTFGPEGVDIEEAYATFTSLPYGFLVKAGKMRSMFGKVNTLHSHNLPWIDHPLMTENLLGGEEGISDAGVSVSHLLPAPGNLFLEATGQVYRGESPGVFTSSRRSDALVVGHLKSYYDLTDQTNIEVGGSYARGHNEYGSDFITRLFGFDTTLRWKPLRRSVYRSFIARTEMTWSRRDDPAEPQRAFGYFGSLEYQFARRWFLGGRYDWSERAEDAALHDSGGSVLLTYWPSEFSSLRTQLRHVHYAEGHSGYEALFQLLFVLGAHGAHPF